VRGIPRRDQVRRLDSAPRAVSQYDGAPRLRGLRQVGAGRTGGGVDLDECQWS
jgi:hypothetical protein